jgi:hypothetical protein
MSWTRESNASLVGGALLVGAILAQASPAFAQTSATDAATAQALFDEAKRLSEAGDYASACPKLAESNRLDPGGGTLTALAVCHESLGKTASAWAEFIQVASDARLAHRGDREKFAKQHIAVLEPKLSKLTVIVDPGASGVAGLEVRRDDVVVGKPTWGIAVPVDPGDHTIEARARGKQTWSTHVNVGGAADMQTVTVPPLDDAPTATTETTPSDKSSDTTKDDSNTPPDASPGHAQRVAAVVVGSAGVVMAAVGVGFGVSALSNASSANQACPNPTCGNQAGLNDESSAKSAALLSDVMFGGAIAAVGVGVVLFVTAPHGAASAPAPTPATESFVPLTFRGGGGLGYVVRW